MCSERGKEGPTQGERERVHERVIFGVGFKFTERSNTQHIQKQRGAPEERGELLG